MAHPYIAFLHPAPLQRQLRAVRKKTRGWLRDGLGMALSRLRGRPHYADRLDPQQIATVLVCRINPRMGNALFMTPLLRQLHELLPAAQIDVASTCPQAPLLFSGLPGVRRVILFPYRDARFLQGTVRALRQLRAQRYDLIIDPVPTSAGGRLVLSLAHARYRLGFDVKGQWAALTHAAPLLEPEAHRALQPLSLVSRVLAPEGNRPVPRLWLPLSAQELQTGRQQVAAALRTAGYAWDLSAPSPVFGFFAHARGGKQIDQQYWLDFWDAFRKLEPAAVPLEFLPAAGCPPTLKVGIQLHLPCQRELTAAVTACRIFISGDTGPMHLASSTPVPTVALFKATDARLYRPLKYADRTLEVARFSPQYVAECCHRIWQQQQPLLTRSPGAQLPELRL